MYEVTCFRCGHVAHISPDIERCAVCGADLKHLITPEYASRYFYDRAAEIAAAGEVTLALIEVERGLAYRPTAELNLLAAILSQRLRDYSQVRRYVAAIAVDDVLRPEAEWLLRSQQAELSTIRRAEKERHTAAPVLATAPAQAKLPPPTTVRPNPLLYGAAAVLLVLLVAWFAVEPLAQGLLALFAPAAGALARSTPTPAPGAAITTTLTVATPSRAPLVSRQTPTPTVAIAPDLVQLTVTQEPLAAGSPVELISGAAYDLPAYLRQTNRPELAELEVAAVLLDGTLTLQGIVQLYDQRASLIELAERIPNVTAVDATDLLIRLPETYLVQEGDSLWLISYKLYGVDRVADLYNANRTLLPSPEALRPGQLLEVPPVQ